VRHAYDVVRPRRRPRGARAAVPVALAIATVAAQIGYALASGDDLRRLTLAVVVLFAATCVTHAWAHRGPTWALTMLVLTAGFGLAVEAVGVRTGFPFGHYSYADSLGPRWLGVPVVVPLAWTMMGYPVLLAARSLSWRWAPLVGAVGLAGWDAFVDAQMVDDRRWRWHDPTPSVPGVHGVPLTDLLGWLLTGLVLMALLHRLLPRDRASQAVPAALYLWTYAAYVVGNLVFFGSRDVAIAGGVAMGLVAVPYAWWLFQQRP